MSPLPVTALLFSFLLHLFPGLPAEPIAWVQEVQPRKMAYLAARVAELHAERFAENHHLTPEALKKLGQSFPGPLWRQAAKAHGVDPVLLYSVALFESGRRSDQKRVGPWPYALHFNDADVSIYALSAKEARFVLAHVTTENVDIGLGQVNYKSHKDKVRQPEDLLDPKTNLAVASQVLAEALNSTPDPELGIGRYHSWTEWRARAYGRKILTIYRVLKEPREGWVRVASRR